jgi:hypothetical protein
VGEILSSTDQNSKETKDLIAQVHALCRVSDVARAQFNTLFDQELDMDRKEILADILVYNFVWLSESEVDHFNSARKFLIETCGYSQDILPATPIRD